MIVIGTSNLKFTRQTGSFFCPRCMESQTFKRKLVRQFLTVYFIPLIPLHKVSEYIECERCKAQFSPESADLDAEAVRNMQQMATFESIRRVLVLIVSVDNVVTEAELAVVRDFTRTHLHVDVSQQQLVDELERLQAMELDVHEYIQEIAADLGPEEKDLLIYHAFLVASTDGQLSESCTEFLKQFPKLVGVSETRFRQVIQRAAT